VGYFQDSRLYAAAPDGQRFLLAVPLSNNPSTAPITVVTKRLAMLKN